MRFGSSQETATQFVGSRWFHKKNGSYSSFWILIPKYSSLNNHQSLVTGRLSNLHCLKSCLRNRDMLALQRPSRDWPMSRRLYPCVLSIVRSIDFAYILSWYAVQTIDSVCYWFTRLTSFPAMLTTSSYAWASACIHCSCVLTHDCLL